jgi:hypothetical protein
VLDDVFARFRGVRHNGNGWAALCSSHEDHNPSLSIHERDGKFSYIAMPDAPWKPSAQR